jgi:hypothetical protein
MSLSSVGSPNPYSYLQWPQHPGSVDTGDPPTDPLQSLYQAFMGGNPNDPQISADGSGGGNGSSCGCMPFSPALMSALLSIQSDQGNSGGSRLQSLFGKFDANGDSQISQSEFETAIGPGADKDKVDALFAKLDGNGDGSVTEDELQSALQKAQGGHHHHHGGGAKAAGSQGSDPLQALLSGAAADGATSQSSTNSDGSTTTTISYADGSKIDMSVPAALDASGPAGASTGQSGLNLSNFLERLISLQAQLFAPTTDLTA